MRALLREPVQPGQVPPRVLFVRPLRPQQLEWARRRAARGVDIVVPLGEVHGGAGGTLWSAAGWQSITTTGAAEPGGVEQRPLGLAYPPLGELEAGLADIAATVTRTPAGVVIDDRQVPHPALAGPGLQPHPELFTVTIARHTDGVNYRVGDRVVTVDELASLVWALPESAGLPVVLRTDHPVEPWAAQLLADHLQRPVLAHDVDESEGEGELRWWLYQPRRLGLSDAGPVVLGDDPTGAHALAEAARAISRSQEAEDLRELPQPRGGTVRLDGRRIIIDPVRAPLFEMPHENDLFQVAPGRDEVYVYVRSRPESELEQALPAWDLGRVSPGATWALAGALGSVSPEVWRGQTLVVVADSHFDGVERAGQLLANYTGSPVVAATRQVWARDGVLVSASAALYAGPDGGRPTACSCAVSHAGTAATGFRRCSGQRCRRYRPAAGCRRGRATS